jgi:uncharacterized membrane protein required for colicin V production
MGLDVALGIIILIAGIRGWLQGFVYQAVRLGGLIACVYAAAPVRDQAKPYVQPYLPTMQPELIDRLLWWVSAVASYVVIVGGLTLAIKMTRRPEIPGMPMQRSRNDQFAGFLLGLAKGALVAAFVVAALQKYAMDRIETNSWADQQVKSSLALLWNSQYHPASRIWNSVPVRHFVGQAQRMGLPDHGETGPPDAVERAEARPVVKTARKATEDASRAFADAETRSGPPAPPAPGPAKAKSESSALEEEVKAAIEAASRPK